MTADQFELRDNHPEGLTDAQEKLIDLFFTTKTEAKVGKRETLPDGTYHIFKHLRPTAPIDFAQEGEFALKLHDTNPSAPLSPIYINLRELPENVLDQIGKVLSEVTHDEAEPPDFVTGIPKAGIALAQAYSRHSGIPFIEVFEKEEHGDGTRKIFSKPGVKGEGKTLRIVDDLATHGETKIEAGYSAKSSDFRISDILVVVDREQGAGQELAEASLVMLSAFTMDQALKYGVRTGHITEDQYKEIREYLAQAS